MPSLQVRAASKVGMRVPEERSRVGGLRPVSAQPWVSDDCQSDQSCGARPPIEECTRPRLGESRDLLMTLASKPRQQPELRPEAQGESGLTTRGFPVSE